MKWEFHNGANMGWLGLLPAFFSETNPASAVEQINRHYQHGGGWNAFKGFKIIHSNGLPTLVYPGDPPQLCLAITRFRDETVILFEGNWVCVMQPDGEFEVARID